MCRRADCASVCARSKRVCASGSFAHASLIVVCSWLATGRIVALRAPRVRKETGGDEYKSNTITWQVEMRVASVWLWYNQLVQCQLAREGSEFSVRQVFGPCAAEFRYVRTTSRLIMSQCLRISPQVLFLYMVTICNGWTPVMNVPKLSATNVG